MAMKRKIWSALLTAVLAAGLAACDSGQPRSAAQAVRMDVAFSPRGGSLELVLSGINSARESILVAAYSFTSKPLSLALLEAWKRGVKVRVVADEKSNSGRYTAATFLANQGIPVRLNAHYAIMHNKFMVIDGKHVETGSFNYSAAAADKNAENVLVLWDAPNLAARYAAQWQRLWDEAEPLPAAY